MGINRLDAADLRWNCTAEEFVHEGPLGDALPFIGQDRARKALAFGLSLDSDGYNIYVAGAEGVGKSTCVMELLQKYCHLKPLPPDWCYVHNFSNPQNPIVLSLPTGKGKELKQEMDLLVDTLKTEFPKAFESKDYEEKLHEVTEKGRKEKEQLMARLSKLAEESGFSVKFSPAGVVIIPLIGGKVVPEEEVLQNSYLRELIDNRRKEFEPVLKEHLRSMRQVDKELQQEAIKLREEVARFVVEHHMDELLDKYQELSKVKDYLEAVRDSLVKSVDIFLQFSAARDNPLLMLQLERGLSNYRVNVIVDNGNLTCAPVVYETHATYANLFGRIGLKAELGVYVADFQQIVPGSIHKANGGFLILKVMELFTNIGVWRALKRALTHKEVSIQPITDELGFSHPITTLRPEPIPLDVKVILIGERAHYHMLMALDPEFEKLFKVKADFDVQVDNTSEVRRDYFLLLRHLTSVEKLLSLDDSGAGAVLEYACRLAEDRRKLSLQISKIVDLLREANFWAQEQGKDAVSREEIEKALDEKVYRVNLMEERLREMVQRGAILIETQGEEVGQCNGLSVIDLVDYTFGRPNRITARAFPGDKGIINIEREAELSGKVFNKAVLILSGYLGHQYGRVNPISLSATVAFEQSYSMVEGDSASAAELVALLSAISGVPVAQNISITGSVDQRGFMQPVGGVNEKIEGFYHCCKLKGLTGDHMAVFPASNLENLHLSSEVVNAVEEGRFAVYAVSHIDDAIRLMTGKEPGVRLEDGTFPSDTFHGMVEARLEEFRNVHMKGQRSGDGSGD